MFSPLNIQNNKYLQNQEVSEYQYTSFNQKIARLNLRKPKYCIHPPLMDVPLLNNLIQQHPHNMSKYPNDHCSQSVNDCLCARALTMFTSTITLANHSCSVVVQPYKCSLFFSSHFETFWIELLKLYALQWKAKHMLKLYLLTDKSLTNIP
jgi:hypothetical protein